MSNKLKYIGYSVVFQEIPNEVTLTINVSGCPHKCVGCHSKYLWKYEGNYVSDDLDNLIKNYNGLVTCICFMGGDQNQKELVELLVNIRKYNLKTALYSGLDSIDEIDSEVLNSLDYCKIGHYDVVYGGLDNPTTNQKMLKKNKETSEWEDITYKFWRENKVR